MSHFFEWHMWGTFGWKEVFHSPLISAEHWLMQDLFTWWYHSNSRLFFFRRSTSGLQLNDSSISLCSFSLLMQVFGRDTNFNLELIIKSIKQSQWLKTTAIILIPRFLFLFLKKRNPCCKKSNNQCTSIYSSLSVWLFLFVS